jgi:hypothetical protein
MARHKIFVDMDERYFERHRFPKWNVEPNVLMEPRLMPRVFPELTKADHERLAYKFKNKGRKAEREYHDAVQHAIREYGERQGPLISGIYSEHFPEHVKDHLRSLAPLPGVYKSAAVAHWRAAGKRAHLALD